MNEEEIIKNIKEMIQWSDHSTYKMALQGLLDLYNKEKEKNTLINHLYKNLKDDFDSYKKDKDINYLDNNHHKEYLYLPQKHLHLENFSFFSFLSPLLQQILKCIPYYSFIKITLILSPTLAPILFNISSCCSCV